jgi:hypothetical protein
MGIIRSLLDKTWFRVVGHSILLEAKSKYSSSQNPRHYLLLTRKLACFTNNNSSIKLVHLHH